LKVTDAVIEETAEGLLSGGIIVYPTDTVYGIGCDPFNSTAVARLKRIKRRGRKPLPLLIGSSEIAEDLGRFSPQARTLADVFWPGQLTLVVREKIRFPESITCSLGVVGLRVPNHTFLLKLLLHLKTPIIGTSANISGAPPSTTADQAEQQFGSEVDLILDGGRSRTQRPSTVVDVSTREVRLLRAGAIPFDEILGVVQSSNSL